MKYLVSGMADDATLGTVVKAFGGVVTLTAHPVAQKDAAPASAADAEHPTQPAKRRQIKRTARHQNGGEWPAKDSIYDIVLQAIATEPMSPTALRDVLKNRGFSPGSVNSALNRLQKNNKAQPTGSGTWAAAA